MKKFINFTFSNSSSKNNALTSEEIVNFYLIKSQIYIKCHIKFTKIIKNYKKSLKMMYNN